MLVLLIAACSFQLFGPSDWSCDGEEIALTSTWWEGDFGGDTAEPMEDEGFEDVVYTTAEEWEARLNGATDPIPDVDFDTADVVLYRHYYGGCGEEVVFPGACLEGGERVVAARWSGQQDCCDAWMPGWFVLVVAESGEVPLRTDPPDPDEPHC